MTGGEDFFDKDLLIKLIFEYQEDEQGGVGYRPDNFHAFFWSFFGLSLLLFGNLKMIDHIIMESLSSVIRKTKKWKKQNKYQRIII